jgi:hypothetical protein
MCVRLLFDISGNFGNSGYKVPPCHNGTKKKSRLAAGSGSLSPLLCPEIQKPHPLTRRLLILPEYPSIANASDYGTPRGLLSGPQPPVVDGLAPRTRKCDCAAARSVRVLAFQRATNSGSSRGIGLFWRPYRFLQNPRPAAKCLVGCGRRGGCLVVFWHFSRQPRARLESIYLITLIATPWPVLTPDNAFLHRIAAFRYRAGYMDAYMHASRPRRRTNARAR